MIGVVELGWDHRAALEYRIISIARMPVLHGARPGLEAASFDRQTSPRAGLQSVSGSAGNRPDAEPRHVLPFADRSGTSGAGTSASSSILMPEY
jgi:hypothetical protein